MQMKSVRLIAAALASGMATASAADPLSDDRFMLSFGVFDSDFDTQIRVDSPELGLGTRFGLEDDLDLDERDRFARFDAALRIADRHRLSFTYFDAKREHSARLQRQLRFGEITYDLDAQVEGGLEAEIGELLYRYAFLSNDRVRAEVLFGIHQLTLTARLSAELAGEDPVSGEGRASAKGPLPVLGAAVYWQLADRWRYELQAQALDATYNDFDGRIIDVRTGVSWELARHLDLGLYYNFFDLDLTLEKPQWTGKLDFKYHGPQAVVTLSF